MKLSRLSVLLTLLSVPTFFLLITIVIFPFLGLLVGLLAYRKHMAKHPQARTAEKLGAAIPMFFALSVMILGMALINSTYKA